MEGGTVHRISQAAAYLTISSTVVQFCDIAYHINDELRLLWRDKFNYVKLLYGSVRYLPALGHLFNVMFPTLLLSGAKDSSHCRLLLVIKANMGQLFLTLLEIILVLRVYALYRRTMLAKYILGGLYGLVFAMEISGHVLLTHDLYTMPRCHPDNFNRYGLILCGAGIGIFQFTIALMTIVKLASEKTRSPLRSLLLRQGVIVCLSMTCVVVGLLAHTAIMKTDEGYGRACFGWFLTCVSVAGSDLLLGMRKAVKRVDLSGCEDAGTRSGRTLGTLNYPESICLTTVFE